MQMFPLLKSLWPSPDVEVTLAFTAMWTLTCRVIETSYTYPPPLLAVTVVPAPAGDPSLLFCGRKHWIYVNLENNTNINIYGPRNIHANLDL